MDLRAMEETHDQLSVAGLMRIGVNGRTWVLAGKCIGGGSLPSQELPILTTSEHPWIQPREGDQSYI